MHRLYDSLEISMTDKLILKKKYFIVVFKKRYLNNHYDQERTKSKFITFNKQLDFFIFVKYLKNPKDTIFRE